MDTKDSDPQPTGVTGPTRSLPAPVPLPRMAGRRVRLRPVGPADFAFVATLETHPEVHFRWRHRGTTPSPERLLSSLWDGALVVLLAEHVAAGGPFAMLAAYGADLRNGWCSFGVAAVPDLPAGPTPTLDAVVLFLDYLFALWPLRKVYAEAPGFAFEQYASAVPLLLEREGLLKGHDFYMGRHWDKHILSVSRVDWPMRRRPFLPLVTGEPGLDVDDAHDSMTEPQGGSDAAVTS
jgi:hypothetical protein